MFCQSPTFSKNLHRQLTELQWTSLAKSTRKVYLGAWRQRCGYRACSNVLIWPDAYNTYNQSLQLVMFAVSTWQENGEDDTRRFDTVRTKPSHVRWCHQLGAGFRANLLPEHELALHGMRQISPPRRERGAVTITMLEVSIRATDMCSTQHRVFCGGAVMGFFFCLRGSE
ncbi:hypothetical protein PHMEG_00031552 [Phytophthora megakarya]|uniref:Uncharacterized protein n=1 Tax=Phytophthora megakarya TaxID=4795 RepID=A0A225UXT9_9STRA|nr:hypothetical protein PHMEG_00031552 [Phytophthora megakarya]